MRSSETTSRVLFDATRLLVRDDHPPTGIDRVVIAYGRWLKARSGVDLRPVAGASGRLAQITSTLFDARLCAAPELSPQRASTWPALLEHLRWQGHSAPALRPSADERADKRRADRKRNELAGRYLQRYVASRIRSEPTGDIYLNVAHTGLESPHILKGLSQRGVTTVVMVHDLIPITYPEFCAPAAGARHVRRIDSILQYASVVLTNSQATADELADYAARSGRRLPPVQVAPLGVEPAFRSPAIPVMAETPYFVCVGTIEARKNLAFLLTLWRRLAEVLGPAAPKLVLVGRRGWENEAVIDHLERSHSVRNLVHEAGDLDDAQLASLLSGARALLAPSLAEGFDLPVAEALSLGVPVIASDIAVHREMASVAQLLDPLDGTGWLAAIAAASATERPPVDFAGPTWAQHFEILAKVLWPGGQTADLAFDP